MSLLNHVPIAALDPQRFAGVLDDPELRAWDELIGRGSAELEGRVVWNVNSTAKGGGVVELLRPLLGYARGAGVDARWVVISGEPEFFRLTKRIHNHLHGVDGDGGLLSVEEQQLFTRTLAANAAELVQLIHPNDVVILHDPQTAALVGPVKDTGAAVIWRCHVGIDVANDLAREAWSFLRAYVLGADAYVFSRTTFAWEGLDAERIAVIQPSIDAFSAKNAELSERQVLAILGSAGVITHEDGELATFVREDGTPGRVDRRAQMDEVEPLTPSDRIVAQVSRWDRLKDPLGVLSGFAAHVAPHHDAHLLLAGPATDSVADDPEGAGVLETVRAAWRQLPDEARRRVHLASLPMEDLEENATIVNALQHHADVVVQKSLAEGFGLTVAEAMWKRRPVVASRIGGIQDQIVDGESGALIDDPHDLRQFGEAVARLLADPAGARRMGAEARERVRTHFLGSIHLARYFELIQKLIAGR